MCDKNGFWLEIESNLRGKPTKYKCINCNQIRDVKEQNDYISRINDIHNRIAENKQKIGLIMLREAFGCDERIHLEHLRCELKTLRLLYLIK